MCRDCNTSFVWTAGQQSYYRERGFEHASVTPTLSLFVPGCAGGSSCFCGGVAPGRETTCVRSRRGDSQEPHCPFEKAGLG